jgi:hypothetical protein
LDEGNSIRDLDLSWLAEQIKKRKEAGITHRMLVQPDDPNLYTAVGQLSFCAKGVLFSVSALCLWPKVGPTVLEPSPRVVVIDDARFADSARKLFNFIWNQATPVTR